MTPRQRRQHQAAIEKAASAPRKSWLGRFTPLKPVQSAWIKSLLTAWGESFGGRTYDEKCLGGSSDFWSHLTEGGWSDDGALRITEVINSLHKEGLRGDALLCTACQFLFPGSLSAAIDREARREESDFMESAILSTLNRDDPVYRIGVSYYTTRKRVNDLARELTAIAPWLTEKMAKDRVRWCLDIFRAKVFLEVRKSMK
jgi:hypothetical protein